MLSARRNVRVRATTVSHLYRDAPPHIHTYTTRVRHGRRDIFYIFYGNDITLLDTRRNVGKAYIVIENHWLKNITL